MGASRDRLLANSLGLVTSTTAGTSVLHTANIRLPLCSLVGSPQGEGARQAGRRQRCPSPWASSACTWPGWQT
jgi:hypothetical protein